MKKMYQEPRTEELDFKGEKIMIPTLNDPSGGELTPLNPGGSSISAPQRATKLYV